MEKQKVKDLFKFLPKSKHKAGEGLENGEYPFYTSSAVVNKYLDEYDYDAGKLIFATGGSASVHYANSKFAVSTDNFILEPNEDVNAKYVYYYLKNNIQILQDGFHGAGLQHLSKDYLNEINIPILDSDSQAKIVSILDKADEIRQKKKLANDKLDEFLKSTFITMFGDPVTNNKNVPKQKLEIFLDNVRYGTSTPPNFSVSGYSFIRATNIKKGRIVDEGMYFITEEEAAKISKCKLKENEIIIVRSGVNTGDTCIITRKYAGHYAGYDIILTINDDELNPTYLNELLNTNYMTVVIKPLTRRAAQPHLNADQIKNLEIILPPIEDQNKFAQIVEKVEAQKQKNELVIEQMNNLFNSLSQRAFKGDL